MTEDGRPDGERAENLLRSSEFFHATSTRRTFMARLMAAGGGVALGAGVGGGLLASTDLGMAHAEGTDPVVAFGNAAVGAERIAVAFYANALGRTSPYGVSGDVARRTLLNEGDRQYFTAAQSEEQVHQDTLVKLGLSFPYHVFKFPEETFESARTMLAFGERLESIFIGAYLGAIKVAASEKNTFIAEAAAQILGVECEHRVLIREIENDTVPNNRTFEGNLSSNGSIVYATANDAVSALLALGIKVVQ